MQTETYVDKSQWPRGPWDDEPDRAEWRHDGMPCLIVRGPRGNLCGYAAVSPGHPLHSRDMGEIWLQSGLTCHGGVTYAEACQGKICHVAKEGEPDNVWWIGFDCCHLGDLAPGDRGEYRGGSYCDFSYVRGETERLAEQLARLVKS